MEYFVQPEVAITVTHEAQYQTIHMHLYLSESFKVFSKTMDAIEYFLKILDAIPPIAPL